MGIKNVNSTLIPKRNHGLSPDYGYLMNKGGGISSRENASL
jgi:hypothetical protein